MIDINTCFGFYPSNKVDVSIETLLNHIEKNGIVKALTYSLRGVFYDSREGNEETLGACRKESRLVPVAVINPKKTWEYEDEVKRIVEQGFKAVRIFPEQQSWSVDSVPFLKLFKALETNHLPLITGEMPSKLYSVIGESSIPVIFIPLHFYYLEDALSVFPECPNYYAEARQMNSPDAVELFVKVIGSNRLLFGSNLPVEYAGISTYRLRFAGISEADRHNIFIANANKLFNI